MNGKGDTYRKVDFEKYDRNYELIFNTNGKEKNTKTEKERNAIRSPETDHSGSNGLTT